MVNYTVTLNDTFWSVDDYINWRVTFDEPVGVAGQNMSNMVVLVREDFFETQEYQDYMSNKMYMPAVVVFLRSNPQYVIANMEYTHGNGRATVWDSTFRVTEDIFASLLENNTVRVFCYNKEINAQSFEIQVQLHDLLSDLYRLRSLMVDNLNEMGVEADTTMGLTTLANKILLI